MGRVYLDDKNKLVVETDNGKIDGNGKTTTEIRDNEQYLIDLESIAKLMAILDDVTLKSRVYKTADCIYIGNMPIETRQECSIISTEEAVTTIQKELDKANAEKQDWKQKFNMNERTMRHLERESYDRINKAKEMLKKACKINIISTILCGIAVALYIIRLFL